MMIRAVWVAALATEIGLALLGRSNDAIAFGILLLFLAAFSGVVATRTQRRQVLGWSKTQE